MKDVDGRNKSGHDDWIGERLPRNAGEPMRTNLIWKFVIGLTAILLSSPALAQRGASCHNGMSFPQFLETLKADAVKAGVSPRAIAAASPYLVYDQGIVNRDRGQRVFGQLFTVFAGRATTIERWVRVLEEVDRVRAETGDTDGGQRARQLRSNDVVRVEVAEPVAKATKACAAEDAERIERAVDTALAALTYPIVRACRVVEGA